MRTSGSRREWAMIGVYGVLVAAALWTFVGMRGSRARAVAAASSLETCRQLGQRIQLVQKRPMRASLEAKSSADLSRRVETAGKAAGLVTAKVERIEPQSPRRIGETSYTEHATLIQLSAVTLAQLVTFLDAVAQGTPKLDVATIRLAAPRYEGSGAARPETWNVEVTLTYFVFAPKIPPSS